MNKKSGITALCLSLSICSLIGCLFLHRRMSVDSMTVAPAQTPAQTGDLVTRTATTETTVPPLQAPETTVATTGAMTAAAPRDGFAFTRRQKGQLDGFCGRILFFPLQETENPV